MATPAVSEILMAHQGVFFCCSYDPEWGLLPAFAEALQEHAHCVHCDCSPRPDFKPCRCGRGSSTPFSYFDFRIDLDVWREVVEPLWRKDLRRIHSRNSTERRKEAIAASQEPGSHLTDLQHPWRHIRSRADLEDVRIHDLRHSFASRALALGEGLPMIGKLLGHTQVQTTARYAHLARDTVKASAARIGDSIDDDLGTAE